MEVQNVVLGVFFCLLYHVIFLILYELYRRHQIVSTLVYGIISLITGPLVVVYGVWTWFGIAKFYTIVICGWTVHILRFYPHVLENKLFSLLSKFGFILICANIIEAAIREASTIYLEIIPFNVITGLVLCITTPNAFINPSIVKSINPKQKEKNEIDEAYDSVNFDQSFISGTSTRSSGSQTSFWSELREQDELDLEFESEIEMDWNSIEKERSCPHTEKPGWCGFCINVIGNYLSSDYEYKHNVLIYETGYCWILLFIIWDYVMIYNTYCLKGLPGASLHLLVEFEIILMHKWNYYEINEWIQGRPFVLIIFLMIDGLNNAQFDIKGFNLELPYFNLVGCEDISNATWLMQGLSIIAVGFGLALLIKQYFEAKLCCKQLVLLLESDSYRGLTSLWHLAIFRVLTYFKKEKTDTVHDSAGQTELVSTTCSDGDDEFNMGEKFGHKPDLDETVKLVGETKTNNETSTYGAVIVNCNNKVQSIDGFSFDKDIIQHNEILKETKNYCWKLIYVGCLLNYVLCSITSVFLLYTTTASDVVLSVSESSVIINVSLIINAASIIVFGLIGDKYHCTDNIFTFLIIGQFIGLIVLIIPFPYFVHSSKLNFVIILVGYLLSTQALSYMIGALIARLLPLRYTNLFIKHYFQATCLCKVISCIITGILLSYSVPVSIFYVAAGFSFIIVLICVIWIQNNQKYLQNLQLKHLQSYEYYNSQQQQQLPSNLSYLTQYREAKFITNDDFRFPICLSQMSARRSSSNNVNEDGEPELESQMNHNKYNRCDWFLVINYSIQNALCNLCSILIVAFYILWVMDLFKQNKISIFEPTVQLGVIGIGFVIGCQLAIFLTNTIKPNINNCIDTHRPDVIEFEQIVCICCYLILIIFDFELYPNMFGILSNNHINQALLWLYSLIIGIVGGCVGLIQEIMIIKHQPKLDTGLVAGIRGTMKEILAAIAVIVVGLLWDYNLDGSLINYDHNISSINIRRLHSWLWYVQGLTQVICILLLMIPAIIYSYIKKRNGDHVCKKVMSIVMVITGIIILVVCMGLLVYFMPYLYDKSDFFKTPNPWWHDWIVTIFYCILVLVIDEYIMRHQPSIGVIFAIISLFTIPIQCKLGEFNHSVQAVFLTLKCYSVAIPVIYMCLIRIGHQNQKQNTYITESEENTHSNDHEQGCNWMNRVNMYIIEYFGTSKAEYYFGFFLYSFLCLNILEAVIFETFFCPFTHWSQYINGIAGILCIITVPLPVNVWWQKDVPFRFWFVDKSNITNNSKHVDFIMYLENREEYNYIGLLWLLLYCSWNGEYTIRFFSFSVFGVMFVHLIMPLMRSLVKFEFGLFLQSRAHILWLYLCLILIFKKSIFNDSGSDFKAIGESHVLAIWSLINILIALATCFVWFVKYLPKINCDKRGNIQCIM